MSSRHDDDLAAAVLARPDITRILREGHDGTPAETRDKVATYLKELHTTQRYQFYRLLQHPLYPIFRKITTIVEHAEFPRAATQAGRVVYVSNHKSHTDYLVQLVAIDDLGIRPPLIAAGINLFGGPLGLIHRHVTGAIPIRRATKDAVYLLTLKAYIGEVLKRHDLFFYPEGGRSYSGEIKAPKTGLLHAALQSGVPGLVVQPAAVAYDLVLEDRALARQGGVKRRQRKFAAELAEMMTMAVGFTTRAYITFGEPIPVSEYHAESRRDVLDLAHRVRDTFGRLYKVLPTALVASAFKPSTEPSALTDRVARLIDHLSATGANLATTDARQAVADGMALLADRGVIRKSGSRWRVRERSVLRYYARTIQHLLPSPPSGPAA